MLWTDTLLQNTVREKFGSLRLVVVSNREPYMHFYAGGQVVCERPASGMVSGLDPVVRACGGLWVAHGSGTADRLVVDAQGRVPVPPENPRYTLKRVWLTKEEEAGYYYGFANEVLWPLCHIVFTRPRFDLADWTAYTRVNEKFAQAILSELQGELRRLKIPSDSSSPAVKVSDESTGPEGRGQRVTFESQPGVEISGRLYLPQANGRKPAVLLGLLLSGKVSVRRSPSNTPDPPHGWPPFIPAF